MFKRERNLLMSTEYFRNLADDPLKLKGSDLRFWASFLDTEYDNLDNEFAEIRLHYYTNEETKNDIYPIEEIPMIPCTNELEDPDGIELWYPGTLYCPEWSDKHVLY